MREEEEPGTPKIGELTRVLLLAALISGFGSSFQYGYNLSVIDYPAKFVKSFYNETYRMRNRISIDHSLLKFLWGITISFFPLGGIVGSLLVGPLVDSCGRKGTLVANNFAVMISAILMGCSKAMRSYELFILARFIIGMCSGISFSIVPMYLTELAPKNLRGAIGSIPYLFIIFGSLMAHIFGFSKALGTQEGWPILLSLTGIPALFQAIVLPFFPESPRYLLIQRQNEQKARQALKKLRGWDDVEDEMDELQQEDLGENAEKKIDVLKLLWFGELRWHLLTIIILMAGQQFSGVNAVQYYSERIYLSTGIEENIVWYIRWMLFMLFMLTTLLAIWTVDTSGRRTLLLVGYGTCSICCVLTAMSLELQKSVHWMSYFSSSFITIFFIGQSIGPGPVTNVLIAELFLQSSRSTAFVIAGCVHWLCKFLIVIAYLHIDAHLEPYSFLIFWPLCIASFIYISKMIPETKGRTFLEIRQLVAIHETRRLLIRELEDTD